MSSTIESISNKMLKIKNPAEAATFAKDASKKYAERQHKSATHEANLLKHASPKAVLSNKRGSDRLGGNTPRIARGVPRTYLAQAAAEANKTAKRAQEAAKNKAQPRATPTHSQCTQLARRQ